MKTILFYDTETTGLPQWKIPSDDPAQPHLVQLAAVLCDEETRQIISEIDVIIRPEGWEIPEETVAIHGISNEKAKAVGISESLAIELILEMAAGSTRVAYNKTFDQRIIRIGAKRYLPEDIDGDDRIDVWAEKEDHKCAMIMAQKMLGGRKKLVDAYQEFTGKELVNAHSAMADTKATMEIYWIMKDRGAE